MADAPVLTAIQLAGRTSADIPNLYSAEEDLAFHQGLIAGKTVMVAACRSARATARATRSGFPT